MVSTYSPNIQLEEPARGDQVGVWDTPVNSNMTVIDRVVGAINVISLNNSPVVLSAAQFQSKMITFNSTLTGSVAITFPSTFVKSYEIYNACTGSSAFVVTLGTTVGGGQVISCPPGEIVDVVNDGTNLRFKNLGRVGTYWDFGGSSVPAWVTGCTIPPYLNCDGSVFSAVTFPTLAIILGGTTLPDSKGRFRAALNQGTGRITSGASNGGVDGNTPFSAGGAQATTLSSLNMPPIPLNDPGHVHVNNARTNDGQSASAAFGTVLGAANAATINSALTGITAGNASPTSFTNLPPSYIGGLTLIRAA